MSLWWYFLILTKICNGDGQRMLPNNSEGHERSITINNCCSYEMVMVTIYHYNHYSWWTLSVTTSPILLVTMPLVMFSFWWQTLFWPSSMSLCDIFLPSSMTFFLVVFIIDLLCIVLWLHGRIIWKDTTICKACTCGSFVRWVA